MSQDPQDHPLCIVSPAEGRFGEHERQRVQEQLNTGMKGRIFVVDHPVTVTPTGITTEHAPYVDVLVCDWDKRYEAVKEILASPAHPKRPEYTVKSVTIALKLSELDNREWDEAEITVTYRYIGEIWRVPTVNVTISGEAN